MGINDPAPALGRGLRLLRLLDGQPWRLEDLVRATALPRSSLARLLDSLAANGCVRRDGHMWHAIARLSAEVSAAGLARWRAACEAIAASGLRGELWAFAPGGPVLVAVASGPADPPGLIGIGWSADREEWMAPVQLWWARLGGRPRRVWYRHGGGISRIASTRVATDLAASRRGGDACCPRPNQRGITRAARLLPEGGCIVAAGIAPVARLLAALPAATAVDGPVRQSTIARRRGGSSTVRAGDS
jgi:hypothetical protein